MSYTYAVSYGPSATGPWTTFNSVSATSDTITGLSAGTSYYVRIITTDSVTGLSSTPVISGPFGTAGAVTITGITLTSSTFTGGAATGTTIGTIAVQMTGGTFSGTLSVTGTNASDFQISGTTLETLGTVAAGSYSINIVATQVGATGSPFSQAETITGTSGTSTGPTATSTFVTADFTSLTGQTVSQFVWGVSSGNMGLNNFAACANSTVISIMNGLQFPCWRFNASGGWAEAMYPNGGTNASQATFNSVFGNLINNAPKFMTADARIIIGLGNDPPSFWSSKANYAAACKQIAQYFLSTNSSATGIPLPIYGFELAGNEQNSQGGSSTATLYQYFNAAAVAIRSVSTNFHCCGQAFSWGYDLGNFAISCNNVSDPTGSNCQVVDAHNYVWNPSYTLESKGGVPYALQGAPGNNAANVAQWMSDWTGGGGPSTVELMVGEYNQNGLWGDIEGDGPGQGPDNIYMVNYVEAFFIANSILAGLNASNSFTMANVWDAYQDTDYGLVGANDVYGGGNSISPAGYLVSLAASRLYGTRCNVTIGSQNPGLTTLAVKAGPAATKFGVMLINASQSVAYNSAQVALSHWPLNSSGTASISMMQVTSATTNAPTTTTLNVTAGLTSTFSMPAPSLTILYS